MNFKNNFLVLSVCLLTLIYLFDCISGQIIRKDICRTTACESAGRLINSSIDPSIDPCDDFYEFSCGGWKRMNAMPKHLSVYGSLDELQEYMQNIMKNEMSTNATQDDSVSVRYALDYYKACTNYETLKLRGVNPLITVLNRVGGWPLMGKTSKFDENQYYWKDWFANRFLYTGQSALFQLTVYPDANNTDVNILYFGVPEHGLGRNQLVNTNAYPDIVNAYKKYILNSAQLLSGTNGIIMRQTMADIDELVRFQTKLANLTTKPEDMRQSKVWYNKRTFTEFNTMTANTVDWLKLSQSVFSKLNSSVILSANDSVIVEDIAYYKGVTELLANTSNRVIANHMGWIAVQNLGVYTTKRFRQLNFEFDKVKSGIQKANPLWKYCIDTIEAHLPFAYSRRYIDNHFSKTGRKEAKVLVKYLRKSMQLGLMRNDWLDDITRNMSIEKLDTVSEDIAYPGYLMNNTELDRIYNLTQTVDKNKPFKSLLYLQTMSAFNMLEQLRRPVQRENWITFPAKVNAFYNPRANTITIPGGILNPPFFRSQVPVYMNFGAIGQVIGHEFTHGFDDQGSEYDSKGNLNNWWNDCTKRIFKEKKKCFINKFSNQFVPEVNLTLNAMNTVGEDISDAGGIKQAFRAYKLYEKYHGKQERLPYVSQYSNDQLFFISFANILCSHIRPEALRQQIEYNPHSPAKYRVNVQLSKFQVFSKVFKCKAGQTMNVGLECDMW